MTPVTAAGGPDPIAAGYAACERATRRAAANFSLGIRLLPRERRRALSSLYWFFHLADETVDGAGSEGERRSSLARIRGDLDSALAGSPPDARWAALADAVSRYAVAPSHLHALIDGVARDLEPVAYADWDALRSYCWEVAGVIGLVSLRVFGGSGAVAERAAEHLGYALQLTNILRDIREDGERGRWYLPMDETRRFGVDPASVVAGVPGAGFAPLFLYQVERARALYHEGSGLYRLLPASIRPCPAALASVYRGLLERMADDPSRVLRERVALAAPVKVARVVAGATRALTA
ncbi:MAG TPA: squalene/phytoene synthase family protein [Gemmatimonadota bacterium]|nr:squalene/phytoene synthase family protein [Gemmatimonadota bacterium]